MGALKWDVDKSMYTPQDRQKRNFDENVQNLRKIKVRQFLCMNKLPRAVLAYKTFRIASASYNKKVSRALSAFKVIIVRENTLTILKNGIGNTITIVSATQATVPNQRPHINDTNDNASKKSLWLDVIRCSTLTAANMLSTKSFATSYVVVVYPTTWFVCMNTAWRKIS